MNVLAGDELHESQALETMVIGVLSLVSTLIGNQQHGNYKRSIEEAIIGVIECMRDNLDDNYERFTRKSVEVMIEFALHSGLLLDMSLDSAVKFCLIDLLGVLFSQDKEVFKLKGNDNRHLNQLLRVYAELLIKDEEEFQHAFANGTANAEELLGDDRLSGLILESITVVSSELRGKKLFALF